MSTFTAIDKLLTEEFENKCCENCGGTMYNVNFHWDNSRRLLSYKKENTYWCRNCDNNVRLVEKDKFLQKAS